MAFILALGQTGGLWTAQRLLPVLRNSAVHLKCWGYLDLFAIVGGAIFVERWLRLQRRHGFIAGMILVAVSALMIYHSALPFSSFFTYTGSTLSSLTSRDACAVGN